MLIRQRCKRRDFALHLRQPATDLPAIAEDPAALEADMGRQRPIARDERQGLRLVQGAQGLRGIGKGEGEPPAEDQPAALADVAACSAEQGGGGSEPIGRREPGGGPARS